MIIIYDQLANASHSAGSLTNEPCVWMLLIRSQAMVTGVKFGCSSLGPLYILVFTTPCVYKCVLAGILSLDPMFVASMIN